MKALTLIERYGFQDPDRRLPAHDQIQLWVYTNFHVLLRELFPTWPVTEFTRCDLRLEYPIIQRVNYHEHVVGFVDIYCQRFDIAVEVKTGIPSIGDLIRQIQFYRQFFDRKWIVVSPDAGFRRILDDHGIMFYRSDFAAQNTQKSLF